MQILYIAQFDVAGGQEQSAEAVYSALLDHLAGWLSDRDPGAVTRADLTSSGEAQIRAAGAPGSSPIVRTAAWQVAGAEDVTALRLELSQPMRGADAAFITRVTVTKSDQQVTLRVVMGRRIATGWLSPADVEALHRPWLIARVVRDEALDVRVLGQKIDGRYARIRDTASVGVLVDALQSSSRLPVLIMHPRDESAWELAKVASGGLVGLATVVTLNYTTARALTEAMPHIAVPDGGALLVWPDPDMPPKRHPRNECAGRGPEGMRALWMQQLAELSVVARGFDEGWESARRAERRAARSLAEQQLAEARNSGSSDAQITALTQRLSSLQDDLQFWEEEATQLHAETQELRSKAANAEQVGRERDYWKGLYFEAAGSEVVEAVDPWTVIPRLNTSEAQPCFSAIEAAADGHIIFTDAACASWERCGYPYPDEMTEILIKLAKAAVDLYTGEASLPRLDEWFKAEHGMNVALSDLTIKTSKTLRYFEYEGKRRDQLPHVKVRDAVKPNEVGRIHFALDSDEKRFIVNHVGLKLYGL
jgi:hypothetical protein